MAALAKLAKLATDPKMQEIASSAAGKIVAAADATKGTIAALPSAVKTNEIPAATIAAKSDDLFIQIGEKLCSSMQEIVEKKQNMIINNINNTITKHLESDSVKEVMSKKIEETLNTLPNKEELIKNVNDRIKQVVNAEIEKTFTNPDTFEKIKEKLRSITDTSVNTNNTPITGGTRKYKTTKRNKRTKSLKLKKRKL